MLIHGEQLVLRIAYAGAPLSGKTETLKALLTSLRGPGSGEAVFSPFSARGRTLYFDWAQYQGGTFRDGPLRCQITSVPGQATLHRRRRLLIEDADTVVFVIDSQRDQLEANQRSLAELKPWLERGDLPPVGVVYQANKRDLAGALSIDELRRELNLGDAEIHESNALAGEGVRVCFIAAVRACVVRAEELRSRGRLTGGTPSVTTGEELLERLRLAEADAGEPAPLQPLAPLQPEAAAAPVPAAPALSEAAASPEPTPEPGPAPARRPAVMPMAAWRASEARRAEPAASGPRAVPVEPEPPARPPAEPSASIEPRPALAEMPAPPPLPRRPAVVPIADWRAGRFGPAALPSSGPRSVPTVAPAVAAVAAAAVPAAAVRVVSAMAAAPAIRAVPAPAVLAPAPAPFVAAAAELPAPWLPGREAMLIEAWPPGVWREIVAAANPQAEPPAAVGGTLRGRIGGGWQARAWGVLKDPAAARAELGRLVTWLRELGDMVSSRRAVVLGRSAAGLCVWQVVRQELTFDLLVRQSLEQEQLSKYSVQVLARVATDFILAVQEFALRAVELPIHFQTLAHENRSTVYSAFLPPAPVPLSDRDPLVELASELRSLLPPELLRSADVTEALRELEFLRETRPQLVPTVEVLQSMLIGE